MKKRIHIFWHFYLGILLSIVVISMFTILYFSHVGEKYAVRAFVIDAKQAASYVTTNKSQGLNNRSDLNGLRVNVLEPDAVLAFLAPLEFVAQVERTDVYVDPERDLLISIHPLLEGDGFLVVREIDLEQEFDQLSDYQKTEVQLNDEEDLLNVQFQFTIVIGFIITIALALLVLIAWLKRILTPIQRASLDWREGNLATRIDVTSPEPFYSLFMTMNKMAEDLENLMQEQKVMSFAMSHELRNPLNGLFLAIEVVARKHDFLNNDEAYCKLKRYANELESLSLNILTLAKVSNSENHTALENCDLSALVSERMAFHEQNNSNIQYQNTIESNIELKGLPLYFELIIDNIVSNASRYAESKVTTVLRRSSEQIEIIVQDDGPGISSEKLEFVMMPFSRLDYSRSKISGGFGLGLAIVNAAVKRLGGTIDLKNNTIQGLVVEVKLPSCTQKKG
ncbi:sensor histidine kinase [Pseudoalteromonas luteoviolacea]|nr:ATP-binding protein [Pseudoalteromonas luteoviolacea]